MLSIECLKGNYNYDVKRVSEVKLGRLKEHALIESIFKEGNGTSGAQTIAEISN